MFLFIALCFILHRFVHIYILGTFNLTDMSSDLNELTASTDSDENASSQHSRTKKHLNNVHVLRLINITEPRNFTCQAQNTFGLVVFNLSLIIKGNFFHFWFYAWFFGNFFFTILFFAFEFEYSPRSKKNKQKSSLYFN